jgi:hypothetical protein
MRGVAKLLLATALAALLLAGFAACGGDSSDSNSANATAQDSAAAGSGSSTDEASAGFRTPGGDNSIQNFGEEADAAEVEAASAALTGYMQARAQNDRAKECIHLAAAAIKPLEQLASGSPQFKGKGCTAILTAVTAGTPSSTRVDTMTDGIASLRVEGDRGFALYHGAKGIDYFVPMTKEDGEWKVGALAPTEFP